MAIIVNERTKFKLLYFDNKYNECSEMFDKFNKAEKRKKEVEAFYPHPIKVDGQTQVNDYLEDYINVVISSINSPKTFITKKSQFEYYMKKLLKRKLIKDMDDRTSSIFIDQLEKSPVNPLSTTKDNPYISQGVFFKCYRLICDAFHYLYINEVIDDNSFAHMSIKRIQKPKNNKTKWSITLFEEMMNQCGDSDLYVFLHLLFNTGLSIKEIRALEISDIVIDGDYLNKECCYINSSNLLDRMNTNSISLVKEEIVDIFDSKQSNSKTSKIVLYKKTVPTKVMLPNSLANLLLEYIELIRSIHHKNNAKHRFLFTNDKSEPLDDRTLYKKFEAIRPADNLSFISLSRFGAMNTRYSVGEIYYYQLDGDLKLPSIKYKDRNTQIKKATLKKQQEDFLKKIERAIPTEEDVNINMFMDFLNTHDSFRIQLIHKLKEVI